MTPDALTRYLVEIVDDVHVDDTTGAMVDVLGADRAGGHEHLFTCP